MNAIPSSTKELNPELFPNRSSDFTNQGVALGNVPSNKVPPSPSPNQHLQKRNASPFLISTDPLVLELKTQFDHMTEQLGKITTYMNEFVKSTQGKMEKFTQLVQKNEQSQEGLYNESQQRFSQMNLRLGERKAMDLKIQEMLDRHNGILRSYEVRLNQLQKLITDKEAQLIQSQASLNEARMEIARLKRL